MRVVGSTVVTPDGVLRDHAVEIADGRIVAIEPVAGVVPDRTIVPGFVDLQVNGSAHVDIASATDQELGRLDRLLLSEGTTSWCPTLVSMPLDRYAAKLDQLAQFRSAATSTVIGAHLEGPFLGGRPGAHDRTAIVPIDMGWIDELPPVVRMMTIAPELDSVADAIGRLVSRNVLVSLGHSAADLEQTAAAVRAGARLVTHIFNAMPSPHHREPGLAGAALSDDRLAVSVIPDLVHVHPAMVKVVFRAKGARRVVVVTDAVGHLHPRLASSAITFDGSAPRLADGTLAGSALSMPQALANLVEAVGVRLDDAVHAVSTTPADRIGLADRGRIEPRCRADLVVLDDGYRVARTIVGGEVVHEA